ncbi:MAG: ATP-dependent helicase [Pseudomonadota bacterium]
MYKLNDQQKAAAAFMFGTASVIAIPGSGKTLTMAARIGNLVSQGIPPDRILGLTFTRNAAGAMREKLRPVLMDQASRVTLSTIHSFCHRLLKEEGRTFGLLHGRRQVYFLKKVIRKLRVESVTAAFALREIGLAKSRLVDWEPYRDLHKDAVSLAPAAKIYEAYEEEKRKRLLLDFHDLLMEAHRMLTEHDDWRDTCRRAYPHILVDEYQDTNPAQVAILKQLAGGDENSSLWVCGDDWQSIFSFTGADVGNVLHFAKHYPGSARFILDTNYRSTPQILSACQSLISHNERKIDKQLNTMNPPGENVIVLKAMSEENEAEQIVTEIRDLVGRRGYAYRDIAVLYRANSQSRAIEEAFARNKIPYRIESEASFYHRYEVSVLLHYLQLIHDPDTFDGDEALKAVINVPSRYIGHAFFEELEEWAEAHDLHLYPALKVMPLGARHLEHGIRAFTELIDDLAREMDWLEPAGLLERIRFVLDFDKRIADEMAEPVDGPLESLDQLQMAAGRYDRPAIFWSMRIRFEAIAEPTRTGLRYRPFTRPRGWSSRRSLSSAWWKGSYPTSMGTWRKNGGLLSWP